MPTKVLLVEDEALIALDVQDILEGAGFSVIGPASHVRAALALLSQTACDCAVLDIHLNGEQVWPVAHALQAQGIPFIFLSGSATARDDAGEVFGRIPRIAKPVNPRELLAGLEALARLRNGTKDT